MTSDLRRLQCTNKNSGVIDDDDDDQPIPKGIDIVQAELPAEKPGQPTRKGMYHPSTFTKGVVLTKSRLQSKLCTTTKLDVT